MRLRAITTISVCSLILIGCAAFPRHPDRKPTIWEVITAYTNPAPDAAPDAAPESADAVAADGEAQDRVAARAGEEDESEDDGTPTATLLPGTRVSVAQTRVHTTKVAMTAEAAPPTATLLPGTRVSVAQTRVHLTRLAMTATSVMTTTPASGTPASGTRVAIAPTQDSQSTPTAVGGTSNPTSQATSRATSATRSSTPRSTTPRATATQRPAATSTPTARPTSRPTTPSTRAATPTRRVDPTPGETPTSPPSPPENPIREDVYIRSHAGQADGGEYVVVGEIINGEGYPIYGARVVGTFFDASGNLIGAQEEMAIFPKTHTEQSNPFRLAASDPAGQVESYELSLVWEDISVVDFAPIEPQAVELNDDEGLEISGELRNDQSTEVTSIILAITFYDEDGSVVAAYRDFYGAQTVAPGDTLPFTLSIPDPELEYDTFIVQAQGNLNLY